MWPPGAKGTATNLRLPAAWPTGAVGDDASDQPHRIPLSCVEDGAGAEAGGDGRPQAATSDLDQPLATRRSPRNVSRRAFSALANSGTEVKLEKPVRRLPCSCRVECPGVACVCNASVSQLHSGQRSDSCKMLALAVSVLM